MKIGYPCINRSIGCISSATFRLRSYSRELLLAKAKSNLDCLAEILKYNLENNIYFFRISSDLVPFASHPICRDNWQEAFKDKFREIGRFIKSHNFRISMHPDQFTLINSIDESIFERSIKELSYHAAILNLLGLGQSAKIQIHVGGTYNDKEKSIQRFVQRYKKLPKPVKERLSIENDEKSYAVKDCLAISREVKIPVVFDFYHHQLHNKGEPLEIILENVSKTWQEKDGLPIVDYSSIHHSQKRGRHAESIDREDFKNFLNKSKPYDFDLMLEIKDKEKSADQAVKIVRPDPRFLKKAVK